MNWIAKIRTQKHIRTFDPIAIQIANTRVARWSKTVSGRHEDGGQALYLTRARGRAYSPRRRKALWPCMCGYLLPLGTPRRLRRLRLPSPTPPKSVEMQATGPCTPERLCLGRLPNLVPGFHGKRTGPLFIMLARYQACQVYTRQFTPLGRCVYSDRNG